VLVGVAPAAARTSVGVRAPRVRRRARNGRSGRSVTRKALAASRLIFYDPWVDTTFGEAFGASTPEHDNSAPKFKVSRLRKFTLTIEGA